MHIGAAEGTLPHGQVGENRIDTDLLPVGTWDLGPEAWVEHISIDFLVAACSSDQSRGLPGSLCFARHTAGDWSWRGR